MAIFQLVFHREVVEEAVIYVEADDEQLLRRNLEEIEDCLPDEDWRAVDEDDCELAGLRKMTAEQVRVWGADKRVYKEHHYHYEDDSPKYAAPKYEPPDPRQMALFKEES